MRHPSTSLKLWVRSTTKVSQAPPPAKLVDPALPPYIGEFYIF